MDDLIFYTIFIGTFILVFFIIKYFLKKRISNKAFLIVVSIFGSVVLTYFIIFLAFLIVGARLGGC